MPSGTMAGAWGAATGLGQARAGNARRTRVPGSLAWNRVGGESPTRAAVERRKASAPEAGGSCKRIVRGARRARGADRWRHLFVWCGPFDLRLPALRLPFLFGGETAVALVLAAKLGREGRRENAIAFPLPLRERTDRA
jgi:hypothetical protein